MKASDRGGERETIWTSTAEARARPPLAGDATADVCVVGAGIAGLTTAYLLACEGRRVIVVDDGPIGGGQTCRTTAHLSCVIDDRFTSLIKLFGVKDARLIHESHARAIDRMESNVIAENIACDFERLDGYLLPGKCDAKELDEELEAARECRCDEAVKLAQAPIGDGPCLRFPHQAQFHPLRYLEGLASAIERRGGIIHCGSHVESVKSLKGAVDIRVGGQRAISAAAAVVATNVPFNVHVAIHSKQAPYMTHVVACEVRKGSVDHALYWTMDDPYFYARLAPGNETDHLIVGGEDTKSGHPTDIGAAHRRIEEWTRERFPQAGAVSHRWSGQVMEPVDGPAFLGRSPGEQDVYVITGDSGMGMTHGTIGAMLITDLIAGRENAWTEIYDPDRKTLGSLPRYLRENADVTLHLAAHLTPGDASGPEHIAPGSGAVLREGLHKLAVYRDDAGALHSMTATCPHLGCIVAWNDSEKTWDCPCHGSRFACKGQLISGPANTNLAAAGESAQQAGG